MHEPQKDRTTTSADNGRGPFQRDRARVLHSAGFRRLAAKTQVHTAGADAFLRTRLTHSLEVAQIGREMGAAPRLRPRRGRHRRARPRPRPPAVRAQRRGRARRGGAACGGFEGNAQTLRVLTRLEAKVLAPDGASAGLNLTRAALDAAVEVPVAAPRRQPQVRRVRRRRRRLRLAARRAPRTSDRLPGGAGHGLGRRRGLLRARRRGRHPRAATSDLATLLRDADERAALCEDVAAAYSTERAADLGAVLLDLLADPVLAAGGPTTTAATPPWSP